MNYFRVAITLLLLALLCSCTNQPAGVYEGEIGQDYVSLDFTLESTVIIKEAELGEISAMKSLGFSPTYEKQKGSWKSEQGELKIFGDDNEIIYSLKWNGKDLIEKKSGERLAKKVS